MNDQPRLRSRFIIVGLLVLIAAAYLPALRCGFVNFDDPNYVSENQYVLSGITARNLTWAATTREMGHWHPLTWMSLMLDNELFGLRPGGYHLVNVLLHAANTVLLFTLLQRMTAATWRSAFAAALFALHPLHVESVAWVAERKDVLSTCFLMLTLWAYARYVKQPGPGRYWTCVGWYVLSLMSKAMGVTLPFLLLLLDYWPLGRWGRVPSRKLVLEKLPFLALAIPASAMAYWAEGGTLVPLRGFPLEMRMANAMLSYVGYLAKTFWPTGLAVFYPLRPAGLTWSAAMLAGFALIGVTTLVIWRIRREPWLATGWFWYLGTLVPVIGFVQIGDYSMADRYTYMPLIGIFVILSWSLPARRAFAATAAVAVIICGVLSNAQARHWTNSETLFRHATRVTKDNWAAHINLGVALKQAGRSNEELIEYQLAVEAKPDSAEAHYNLGSALWEAGQQEAAIAHWQEAVRLRPGYTDAHSNLADAFRRRGEWAEADRHYEATWPAAPASAGAYNDMGAVLWRAGKTADAIRYFGRALQVKPDDATAHYNLGGALEQQGDVAGAIHHYELALQSKPDFTQARERLARLRGAR